MTSHNHEIANTKIVISGISGRFPNSDNFNELQYNLLNSIDCTTVDHKTFNYDSPNIPTRIGKCSDFHKFDNIFFGIHDKLSNIMDPLSRILLEHSFEAIMDAGINPRSLKGQKIGVFIGTNISETDKNWFICKQKRNNFSIIGCSKAMIPNRISFFLGIVGHSIHIDNACISSASALEFAYRYMKEGICDAAIVGGSIVTLHPHLSYHFNKIGFFSDDGLTKSFDDNANGCTRSEAVSVLFIQRATDAKRIYQEIINIKSLHVDCTDNNSILYPTTESQIKVMTDILNESKLSPNSISFIEANGVGIKKVDADELEAIDAVYGTRKEPLLIGSIKSNIGNTIPVNSITSIIKIIIASETGQIPPNLNYKTPNCNAKCLKDGRIRICADLIPWTGEYSSVNTASIAGGFSSIILKTPNIKKKNNGIPDDDLLRLIIISGRNEEAVKKILCFIESRPVDVEFLQLLYDIHKTEIDGNLYRGYSIVPARSFFSPQSSKQEIIFNTGVRREVWWIFSGMGSQWAGMGETLLKLPIFEAAIKKCDAVLKPKGYNVYKIITDKDPKIFDEIVHSFIGIAAIQIGLVDTLKAVGLDPDYIIGHSVGELGCAYADGCFTAEQMILSALSRGLASIETKLERGSMAAIGLGHTEIQNLCPTDIDVACHNGPESSTISGPAASMKKFVASLTAKGIFAKEVPCSNIAYHSRYIATAGSKLLERLQKVIPKPNLRSSKWLSTSVPREEWNTIKACYSSAEYHTNNLLSPVLFDEISRLIPPNAICIEIAPHGLLQAILKRSLPTNCINVSLTRKGHPDNFEVLLIALGKLFNAGLHPQIENLYTKVQYPVGRGTPSISSLIKWEHTTEWPIISVINESAYKIIEYTKKIEINLNEINGCKHGNIIIIDGKLLVPISFCLIHIWIFFKNLKSIKYSLQVIFEKIKVHKTFVTISTKNIVTFTINLSKVTGYFEVTEFGELLISGIIQDTKDLIQHKLSNIILKFIYKNDFEISKENFYTEMQMRGFQFSDKSKDIIRASLKQSSALIRWNSNWITFIDNALQFYAFRNDLRQIQIPLLIEKLLIDTEEHENINKYENGVIAVVDTKLNYLSAGGLEIHGLKFSIVDNHLERYRLSNDTLNIVPNIDKSNLSLDNILRVILQLVIENTFSIKIQTIHLIKDNNPQNIKSLKTIMQDVPEASLFTIEEISYQKATFKKALTIIVNNFKNYDINKISHNLGINKFLLIFIPKDQEDKFIKIAVAAGLKIILIRKYSNELIVLLRKKRFINNVHVFNVSKNINETISKIKNTNMLSNNERIIVIIKLIDKINIDEFINQIKMLNLEKIRLFIIEGSIISNNLFNNKFYENQLELDLLINILSSKKVWATLRRIKVTLNTRLCKIWIANQFYSYSSQIIAWTEGPVFENIENMIKVEYSTLNFQDILIANENLYTHSSEMSGKDRIIKKSFGFEFSGVDSKDNRVMGVTYGNSMSNFVKMDENLTWNIPNNWSFEDAVTIPLAYLIAYSSLFEKAQIQTGETILLSDSTFGFGIAILHLAYYNKYDIFVTYKTEFEKNLIQSVSPNIQANHLFKTSNNHFIDNILMQTKGKGVDIIICNQHEIKTLNTFFALAKLQTRVILISDFDNNKIHDNIGMETFLKETAFYSLVPKKLLLSCSERKIFLANMIQDGINKGCVIPLPRSVYNRNSLNEAFNTCINNKHMKKIVVKVQPEQLIKNKAMAIPRLYCSNKKIYLIIDGFTIFGLELIDWLITRGAKHFLITSTITKVNDYKNPRLNLWKSYGIQFYFHKNTDLSQRLNMKALLKEALSYGLIEAIFDLQRMNKESPNTFNFINSTTKILDAESRSSCSELKLFIVCSITVNLGCISNKKLEQLHNLYISQDQVVEELLRKRKQDGLPGQMIKWGLIDSMHEYSNILNKNVVLPPLTKYIEKLDEILGADENVVEVSYTVPLTDEIEEDYDEIKNTYLVDPVEAESQNFTAKLYEPSNTRSYL